MSDASGIPHVTCEAIVQGLQALGITNGDAIQVHSSLSAFGYVEGGAKTVVDALLQLVGTTGTVMVPTFNHGTAEVFDINTTPSTNGAITEALRKRPAAKRSFHPTHSYAVIGPLAKELTAEHFDLVTFDQRSPLGKLASAGGKIVLLGVGMDRNTAVHIGETMANCPCMGQRQSPHFVRMPDGSIVEGWSVLWRDGPCLVEWEPLEMALREQDLIKESIIGAAKVMVMPAAEVIRISYELSCKHCAACTTRPAT